MATDDRATAASFEGPVFVLGVPRSGTKLLRDLLNEHERLRIPPVETELLPAWVARWERFGDLADPRAFRCFHDWCRGTLYFRGQERLGHTLDPDAWHGACRSFDPAGVFEAMVRLHVGAPPGSGIVWGDKSPGYTDRVPLLAELFPDARFVHVVRDPRGVALSAADAWGKHPLRTAQRWRETVERARDQGAGQGGRYLEVRFEELVSEPAGVLRRVTAVLGLEYREAMTRLSAPSENLGSARGSRRVEAAAADRWREQLDPSYRRRIEAITSPLLTELGYAVPDGTPPRERTLSPFERRLYWMHDAVRLLRLRIAEWGLRDTLRYGLRAWALARSRP